MNKFLEQKRDEYAAMEEYSDYTKLLYKDAFDDAVELLWPVVALTKKRLKEFPEHTEDCFNMPSKEYKCVCVMPKLLEALSAIGEGMNE